MPERDMALIKAADIATALSLLTRLPVPGAGAARSAQAAWAYPIAGLAVGAIAALTGLVAVALEVPAGMAAGLVLTAAVMTTGAMHEDGLADSADGLWGGWDRSHRLEIMRDSRIGTYGVLALILSLGLRWTALTALIATGQFVGAIIATAILSRAPMPALMYALPHARPDGLSHDTGRPSRRTAVTAAGIALILGLFCIGLTVVTAVLWIVLASLATAGIARAKIGGQTGDILGATQQAAEIAALAAISATLA